MRRRYDDRAVSEVIGFIIIFGLVVTSVSLVMYASVPALEDAQQREHVANAQRAFSILQDNIDDVVLRGAPARGTQISVHGSELEMEGGVAHVNVTVVNSTGGVMYEKVGYGAVSYRSGTGGDVVYENGGVFRFDGVSSSGMVFEPDWRVTENEVFISTVQARTKGGGTRTFSGEQAMTVRAERIPDSTERHIYDDVDTVNVTVQSPRADGWQVYMQSFQQVDPSDVTRLDEETVSMELDGTDLQRVIHLENPVNLEIET